MCGPKNTDYEGVDPRQVRGIKVNQSSREENVPHGTILNKEIINKDKENAPKSINANFIIDQETGGRDYYQKRLAKPSWPGVESGVTIGAGYDLGYNTPEQIRADWKGYIPDDQIEKLVKYSGVKGEKARDAAKILGDIAVDYDTATKQFQEKTLPRYQEQTKQAFGDIEKLHPDQQTALVSLVFNRGPSLKGERRQEMAEIQKAIQEGRQEEVPGLILKMKRLWPETQGLLKRRDAEANLFSAGFQPPISSTNV